MPELQPEKCRVGVLRSLQYAVCIIKPDGNRLNELVTENVGQVLGLGSKNDVEARPDVKRGFAREHGRDYASVAPRPYRLLGSKLTGEVERLFNSPSRNEGCNILWSNVEDKLPIGELRLEKAVPSRRHFIFSNEFFVVSHHLNSTAYGHYVSIVRIDHLNGNVQHLLLCHPYDVEF